MRKVRSLFTCLCAKTGCTLVWYLRCYDSIFHNNIGLLSNLFCPKGAKVIAPRNIRPHFPHRSGHTLQIASRSFTMSKHVHRLLTSAYPYAGGRISSSALSKTSSFPSPTAANNSGRLAPFRSQTTGGGGSSTPAPSKPNPNRGKGPITWRNFSVLAVAGAGALSFFYYVKNEKDVGEWMRSVRIYPISN